MIKVSLGSSQSEENFNVLHETSSCMLVRLSHQSLLQVSDSSQEIDRATLQEKPSTISFALQDVLSLCSAHFEHAGLSYKISVLKQNFETALRSFDRLSLSH